MAVPSRISDIRPGILLRRAMDGRFEPIAASSAGAIADGQHEGFQWQELRSLIGLQAVGAPGDADRMSTSRSRVMIHPMCIFQGVELGP